MLQSSSVMTTGARFILRVLLLFTTWALMTQGLCQLTLEELYSCVLGYSIIHLTHSKHLNLWNRIPLTVLSFALYNRPAEVTTPLFCAHLWSVFLCPTDGFDQLHIILFMHYLFIYLFFRFAYYAYFLMVTFTIWFHRLISHTEAVWRVILAPAASRLCSRCPVCSVVCHLRRWLVEEWSGR